MRFTRHSIGLAVLLALLIGHVSVAVHAATHASGDTAECDLCITYNDSSEALATHHDHDLAWAVEAHASPLGEDWHGPGLTTSIHQRGPPSIH
jgi:hypothetical protein